MHEPAYSNNLREMRWKTLYREKLLGASNKFWWWLSTAANGKKKLYANQCCNNDKRQPFHDPTERILKKQKQRINHLQNPARTEIWVESSTIRNTTAAAETKFLKNSKNIYTFFSLKTQTRFKWAVTMAKKLLTASNFISVSLTKNIRKMLENNASSKTVFYSTYISKLHVGKQSALFRIF